MAKVGRPRVFVSAVGSELASYRDRVVRILRRMNLDVRDQRDFHQGPGSLLERLRDHIRDCDAIVLLVGMSSGAIPSEAETNALSSVPLFAQFRTHTGCDHASYTQWEFILAKHYEKNTYLFLTAPELVPDTPIDEGARKRSSQTAYRTWLAALGMDRKVFRDKNELSQEVALLYAFRTQEPLPNATNQPKTKIFIAYARKDATFAEKLQSALAARGLDTYFDTADIQPGENWRDRLEDLIAAADSVVFVLSPDSVASPICEWEVDKAEALGKRVFPVVWRPVDPAHTPEQLARINWIYFDDPVSFESSVDSLTQALNTDIVWIREHSRIIDLALRWERSGRPDDQLLRGREITAANEWARVRPSIAPPIPVVALEFIQASARGDTAEQTRIEALIATAAKREQELESKLRVLEGQLKEHAAALERAKRDAQRTQRGIFISYRREDSAPWAGWIYEKLLRYFRRKDLFIDIDTIQKGRDFMEVLDEHLNRCGVMLAIVGKSWISAMSENGRRRLDDPNDFVRREIATALIREIPIIPLLVDGAELPKPELLPADLQPLLRRQASTVNHQSFQRDMEGLRRDIAGHLRRTNKWPIVLMSVASLAFIAVLFISSDLSSIFWQWLNAVFAAIRNQ